MCGIAGIIEPRSRKGLIQRWDQAAERIQRRGPDTKCHLVAEVGSRRCLLGHRRLRIVDTSSDSNQPMTRDHLDMVFNGEIYNFRQLRAGLEEQGVLFETSGDSEVLLNAFMAQGVDCFETFDGMWAAALLDRERQTLTLSRDFFGEKPLYYLFDGETLVFASDILALRSLYGRNLPLNRTYLTHFLHSGYAPPDCCVFEGVQRLEARQTLVLKLDSMSLEILEQQPLFNHPLLEKETAFSMTHFEDLFINGLETRLLADVPLGLMLSGGIDSSYVAATARQELDHKLDCLTIRYGRGSEEETDRAFHVTNILGLTHHVVDVPEAQLDELVEEAIPSMDEPISDVAYPLLLRIVGATPAETRVLLTGDGADELFLSYVSYRKYLRQLSHGPTLLGGLSAAGASLLSSAPHIIRRLWRRSAMILPMSATQMLEINLLLQNGQWQHSRIGTGKKPHEQLLTLYTHAYANDLAEYLLVKSDRASMWHSKEFRTPFLNRKLLDYVGGCHLDSLPRGEKKHLVERLNHRLGKDLGFVKRGMFAKGEHAFHGLRLADLSVYRLPVARTPQERYRSLVLGKWIAHHIEGCA
jgi:asparagine synthase (glutamine-hydrolysing)